MHQTSLKVPEQGTYKFEQFRAWRKEFQSTGLGHIAYIALNFAEVLNTGREKFKSLKAYHETFASVDAQHQRALDRLQNTMIGAAISYEQSMQSKGPLKV